MARALDTAQSMMYSLDRDSTTNPKKCFDGLCKHIEELEASSGLVRVRVTPSSCDLAPGQPGEHGTSHDRSIGPFAPEDSPLPPKP